jgi:hypothetical protein
MHASGVALRPQESNPSPHHFRQKSPSTGHAHAAFSIVPHQHEARDEAKECNGGRCAVPVSCEARMGLGLKPNTNEARTS